MVWRQKQNPVTQAKRSKCRKAYIKREAIVQVLVQCFDKGLDVFSLTRTKGDVRLETNIRHDTDMLGKALPI